MSPFWILLELMMMDVVVTIGAVRHAKLQQNRHHQQTNIQKRRRETKEEKLMEEFAICLYMSWDTTTTTPLHNSYSRKEQVILNRLLISHTHLTHSYLLNKEQPQNCNYCKSLLTVEHILTSCSAYKNIREKH